MTMGEATSQRFVFLPSPASNVGNVSDSSCVDNFTVFEIRYREDDTDGGDPVELVGPLIGPHRFRTVLEAYHYWRRCFAPLCNTPLRVCATRMGERE